MDNNSIVYQLNENDEIIYVNENWNKFAAENDGLPETLSDNVLNKKIWCFITDFETIHLYKALLNNVRLYKRTANLTIKCDSPFMVRFIEMKIKPLENNHIEFCCVTKKQYERPIVLLLDKKIPRNNSFLKMCSYCKAINIENEWVETEVGISRLSLFLKSSLPQISHGICPTCYKNVMQEIEKVQLG
jgi:hypothetical protein